MEKDIKIKFFQRISVRVTLLILIILSIGIGTTIAYYVESQNSTIIESRESAVNEESNVVYYAIKNNMLAGEAPIAVELFREFARIEDIGEIMLFRSNGITAFSDNSTLKVVNKNLGEEKFTTKKIFIDKKKNTDDNFKKCVKNVDDVFVKDVSASDKRIIIYKPLINQPKCSTCHGLDHVVRGVIKISSSLNEVYEKTNFNMILSAAIYSVAVFILSLAIVIFLRIFVISRIFSIGTVVDGVGTGDFKTKIGDTKSDELGRLADQINDMIDGLNERFKLSKFVSKSTLEHVKTEENISLGGEKKEMTVLFSDIRGFTSFSESKEPDKVMEILNDVMNLQSDIVQEFGGDIDKFVGDELMAVFHGEDMALRAARAAQKIMEKMKDRASNSEDSIYVGIGINTGEMISGNMGSGDRMDHTVIGDAVNLGSRLCSAAGKNVIVLSEYTYNYIADSVEVKEHDPIKVKGKEKPIRIYTLRKIL